MINLKDYERKDILFQRGELILYNPNKIQMDEIKKEYSDKVKMSNVDEIKADINLRYIYRNLTSLGSQIDELSDEEFEELLDENNSKYSRDMELLYKEVLDLVNDIAEDIVHDFMSQIKETKQLVNIITANTDLVETQKKLEKFLKKNKILNKDTTMDELINKVMQDPTSLQSMINKKQNKKKK